MRTAEKLTADRVAALVGHFETLYSEHMQDLPIVNPRVGVEAVGFRKFDGHDIGVLITPWFMNLVLLPAGDEWSDSAQGDNSAVEFPSGSINFITSRDETLGTYLTAVLLRSVSDLPDQPAARSLAERAMRNLFLAVAGKSSVSRRELLTGLRGS